MGRAVTGLGLVEAVAPGVSGRSVRKPVGEERAAVKIVDKLVRNRGGMVIVKQIGWASDVKELLSLTVWESTAALTLWWTVYSEWFREKAPVMAPMREVEIESRPPLVRWVADEAVMFALYLSYRSFYGGVMFGYKPLGSWMGYEGVLQVVSAVEATPFYSGQRMGISGTECRVVRIVGPSWEGPRVAFDLGGRYGQHVGKDKWAVGVGFLEAGYP